MIAKVPTIAAMAYKYSIGQPYVYPRNDLDYATNFLRMCFSVPAQEYEPDPILSRAMDRIFTLHADHEQNASTSTVRLAGSSGANPFACIAMQAKGLAPEDPARRTVDVEAFCSWSACKVKILSIALLRIGSGSYS